MKPQRSACKRASQHNQLGSELLLNVRDDAIVCRGGRTEHRNIAGKFLNHANDAPVVGSEIVTPIRYAVDLIDNEETRAAGHAGQHRVDETLVCQTFRRDQKDVAGVFRERGFGGIPLRAVR